ncbi:MAG: dipeptidase [Myxococcota bacterium]
MIAARDADSWSRALGISREAVELYLASEVIDLHLDTFIWQRIFGYELGRRHLRPPLAGWFLGHADFPRVREAGLAAATWVITTNPLREASERFPTLLANIARMRAAFAAFGDDFAFARTYSDYRAARAQGKHAAFLGVQGGNALDGTPDAVERLPPLELLRVTLVHLSNSSIGLTSSPLRAGPDSGLSRFGRELVERLERARIFVDLAHISPRGFWDAVAAHDPSLPLLVTHTGVQSVHRHWRNLDDSQIRAIAESGGVIGIMYHAGFIGPSLWRGRAESVIEHIAHVVRLVGPDYVALGSDFDGSIVPPRDLTSVLDLPRLVELMLGRGFSADTIQKILGQNFLRVLARVRP